MQSICPGLYLWWRMLLLLHRMTTEMTKIMANRWKRVKFDLFCRMLVSFLLSVRANVTYCVSVVYQFRMQIDVETSILVRSFRFVGQSTILPPLLTMSRILDALCGRCVRLLGDAVALFHSLTGK